MSGVLLGVAGASFGVALALGSGAYPPHYKGLAMGLVGAGNVGTAVAALLAPLLAQMWGWKAVYGVAALGLALPIAAIKVLKAELPWGLWAQAWLPLSQVHQARAQLEALMAEFPFASCSLFGRAEQGAGVQLRAAAHQAVDEALVERIAGALGLQGAGLLSYRDARRGQWRRARLQEGGRGQQLQAMLLAGDVSAQAWIAPLLQERLDAQPLRRALLQPGATAPVPLAARGATVCACEGVAEHAITGLLKACEGDAGARLARLKDELRCGTQCGSCVPQLQRMVQASMA